MSAASSLRSARSRPDISLAATGGVYLTTTAGSRVPFERITEIDGCSFTLARAAATASTCGSSSPHASRAARRASGSSKERRGSWADETT